MKTNKCRKCGLELTPRAWLCEHCYSLWYAWLAERKWSPCGQTLEQWILETKERD